MNKIAVLLESSEPYREVVEGLSVARCITAAGSTRFGGGFARLTGSVIWDDMDYDEVIYVLDGRVTVEREGFAITGACGEVLLIPAGGATVFSVDSEARILFVKYPIESAVPAARV